MSAVHPVSLEVLQERAVTHAYDVDAIDWSRPPDPHAPWFPPSQMPLAFTPGYALLDEEERLQANQWYALSVCEQFIFLEDSFLVPAVQSLLRARRKKLAPILVDALETFIVEEKKHGEMFRRVLRAARPDWYADSDYHFYTPGRLGVAFGKLCLQQPAFFVAWPWMGMILEEKTIAYHRAYERAAGQGEPLCPLHRAVHRFHFLDEARHVQLEAHLIHLLYDEAAPWLRAANRQLLFSTLKKYTRPRRRSVSCNVVRALAEKYPRLRAHQDALLDGVVALKDHPGFQREIYGGEAIPQTFELLDGYPEMAGLSAISPAYRERVERRAA